MMITDGEPYQQKAQFFGTDPAVGPNALDLGYHAVGNDWSKVGWRCNKRRAETPA